MNTEKNQISPAGNILLTVIGYFISLVSALKSGGFISQQIVYIIGLWLGWQLKTVIGPKEKASSAVHMGRRWLGWSILALFVIQSMTVIRKYGGENGIYIVIFLAEFVLIGVSAFILGYSFFSIRQKFTRNLNSELRNIDTPRKIEPLLK